MHTIQNMCCALDGKWQCSNEQAGNEEKKNGSVRRCGEGMTICTGSMYDAAAAISRVCSHKGYLSLSLGVCRYHTRLGVPAWLVFWKILHLSHGIFKSRSRAALDNTSERS